MEDQTAGVEFLFPTPVILFDVPNSSALNVSLKPLIESKRANDTGISRSNYGGWHSNVDMTVWGQRQAQILAQVAIDQISPLTADIHPNGKRDFSFDVQMWANINGPNDSNQMHCHPGALWSVVYYVDIGADDSNEDVEGELLLLDPRFPMNTMYMPELVLRYADGKAQYSQYPVKPKNGRMVMFPSWLKHSVRPYRGTRERISVAFNIMVVPS